jgi:hypothetical protein
VEALVLARHEVEVICLRGPGEPGFERRGQVTVRRVPLRISRASRANYLLAYGAFFMVAMAITATRHLRHRFDLVQVNTLPDFLVFAAIVPRLLGARVLLDLQESTPEFYAVKFGTGLRHPSASRIEPSPARTRCVRPSSPVARRPTRWTSS